MTDGTAGGDPPGIRALTTIRGERGRPV